MPETDWFRGVAHPDRIRRRGASNRWSAARSKVPAWTAAPIVALVLALAVASAAPAQSLAPLDPPPDSVEAPDASGGSETRDAAPQGQSNRGSLFSLDARPQSQDEGVPSPPPSRDGAEVPAEGRLCGLRDVEGLTLPAISDPGGCGIEQPVSISRVADIDVEPAAVVSCPAAAALETWIVAVVIPAFRQAGRPLEDLQIAGAYACRNINSAKTGELSEHAFGNAIDIERFGAFRGDISVRDDWSDRRTGALLEDIFTGACGIFGTTLGPDSNRYHRDHFHFDVAERRAPYCH